MAHERPETAARPRSSSTRLQRASIGGTITRSAATPGFSSTLDDEFELAGEVRGVRIYRRRGCARDSRSTPQDPNRATPPDDPSQAMTESK